MHTNSAKTAFLGKIMHTNGEKNTFYVIVNCLAM